MSRAPRALEEIFHAALEIPAAERAAFVAARCAGDTDLEREVHSLLRSHPGQTTRLHQVVAPAVAGLFAPGPEGSDLPVGTLFGPYAIEDRIGEGGMGTVYRARDTRLNRPVAVKMMRRTLAGTAEARGRLLREARSSAALQHPNIAVLYDYGDTDGSPWLVMEYVNGASLRSRLSGRPLAESVLVDYARQIAAALEHAHCRGIVHRDLKPENILVAEGDVLKLIDFGLARPTREGNAASDTITQATEFIGTLAYSAPERFSGAAATAQSDVYSFGVVLYEMACGHHPFSGRHGPGMVAAIVAGEYQPVERQAPDLSPALAAIVRRCLARDPAARFGDGGEIAAALRAGSTGAPIPEEPPAPPRLAVLDFVNIGGRTDVDWLGTAIAETLSADLAKVLSVRIAARGRVQQAVRRAGDPVKDPEAAAALGRDLASRWLVTGGYAQAGDRIRVTAQIVDAGSGAVRATEKVDGHLEDIFDLQDRVVAALLHALTLGFGTSDEQSILPPETRSLRAYEHYARGRQQMYCMDARSLGLAVHHFEQAVELDPKYALALPLRRSRSTCPRVCSLTEANPDRTITSPRARRRGSRCMV